MLNLHRVRAPNPRPHATIDDPDEVPAVRQLHCQKYNSCLALAEARNWAGFACTACSAFEPMTPEEEESDRLALLRLYGRAGANVVFNEAAIRAVVFTEDV
jgi:hypothetical protein